MAAAGEPQIILKSPALTREINRLQNAKSTLKTKLNARNDNQHQIDDETIDQYGAFVDSIPQGGGGLDWSEIGYNAEPQSVIDGYNYAVEIMNNWDSSQTDFSYKFENDKKLIFMPLVDTSNGTFFNNMFYSCLLLTTVPQLDTSNSTKFNSMFNNCSSLTTFGGLKNIGQAYLTSKPANYNQYTLSLSSCSNLTHDSLMNVINNLYDIATKGCNTQQLTLGSTNLAKLSAEEISSATNKGWSLS